MELLLLFDDRVSFTLGRCDVRSLHGGTTAGGQEQGWSTRLHMKRRMRAQVLVLECLSQG